MYIGAPGASAAANSGYVDASTLASIIDGTQSKYASFGGVMLWDVSQAYGACPRVGCVSTWGAGADGTRYSERAV